MKKNKKTYNQPYPPLYPDIEDWPIYKLSEDRAAFIEEIVEYTMEKMLDHSVKEMRRIIEKSIYLERIRIKGEPWKVDPPTEYQFWKRIQSRYAEISQPENEEDDSGPYVDILYSIINRYAEEIVGTFRKGTFRFARKFLTAGFRRMLNTAASRNYRRIFGGKYELYERLRVKGDVELIRSLLKKGTVVVVPTHFSNLDSILIGYAMDAVMGLPAFTYGAGLNLYNSGFTAYFMNRLGAYRVDRRKKNPIYLETLKAMSNLSMQRGVNSLFFPGGTRSRSGAIEDHLKMGLLGTTIEAQHSIYQQGQDQKIFIVPLVLSYHFVLEAKFLIEQHLRRTGKERYLRVKDDWLSFRKILRFSWQFFSESSEIMFSFGKPFDVLGNYVNEEGISYDSFDRPIDVKEYFMLDGRITEDKQREMVYTRNLAEFIVERFHRENIVLSSHAVAFTVFNIFQHSYPELDLFELLRLPTEDYVFETDEVLKCLTDLVEILRQKEAEGELKLSAEFGLPLDEFLKRGVKYLGAYHLEKPLKLNKQGNIISKNFNMLYYYHNRLLHYGLENEVQWKKYSSAVVE